MAQRLTIARALLPEPRLLLLDEPFTGLDQRGVQMAKALILAERDRGAMVVLVSHDLATTATMVDRAIVLRRGRRVFQGPIQQDLAGVYAQALGAG